MKKGFFRRLTAFVFPPVCRVCNERQRVFSSRIPEVLCPDCQKRWQKEKAQCCPTCKRMHAACRCVPSKLSENGCDTLIHLTAYRSHHRTAASELVLHCKDHNDSEVFEFLAEELSEHVLPLADFSLLDAVVTYVPRRRAAVAAIGHDHGKELARMVARRMGLPCEALIRRRILTRQQKELDAAGRERNAARSFEIEPNASVKGKTVILVDDVCTTGASLAGCTALLLEAGAEKVTCAVIAKTERTTE
jgi:ComF family protein